MKGRLYIYFVVCCWACLMASCSSSRMSKKSLMVGDMTAKEYVAAVIDSTPSWNSLSGKVSVLLRHDTKKVLKFSGTLRLKRDEAIQLSVAPFLGIEVARAEITPEGVLILDRVHKRYVEVGFDELRYLLNVDVNFNALQSLFLNELFIPGKKALSGRDASRFHVTQAGADICLEVRNSRRFDYQFLTSPTDGSLKESRIGVSQTPYALRWNYSDFTKLEERLFPRKMKVSVDGVKKYTALSLDFSRLSVDGKWKLHTEIPSKYQRVELTDLLKLLNQK